MTDVENAFENKLDLLLLEPEVGDPEPYPPWNFCWVVQDRLATMAWPQNILNLDYLYDVGIRQLVTLSPEKIPPVEGYSKLEWTLIPVDEFKDPSVKHIQQFIEICEKAQARNQVVGVHCRMGRGRSSVMAACYLAKFKGMSADDAIAELLIIKPNCIEGEEELAVRKYCQLLKVPSTSK